MNTNNNTILFLIGRILVGSFYLYTGLDNFIQLTEKIGYATFKGVPVPTLGVVVASSLLVIAGLSILLGYRPVLGIAAIVLFLVPVTVLMHNFWTISDPLMQEIEFHSFEANIGLAGSALFFLAIPRPWLWSLDEWLARESLRERKTQASING